MSLIKAIRAQLGLSNTATNNFTLDASADNGTMKLARGNAGATTQDILTVDASGNVNAPVSIQQGGVATGRMVLATAQNSTSGTSIDFTGIPSWVKRITVSLQGVSTNGSSLKLVQVGSGSVSSTGYLATSTSLGAAAATTSSTAGFVINANTAADIHSGHLTLTLVSGNTWVCSYVLKELTTFMVIGAGDITLGGALDRVRITTVNGTDTFDAGSINIMYEG